MTTPVDDALLDRWVRLAGPDARALGSDLLARYREPHRHYHTPEHLAAMFPVLDDLTDLADDPVAVEYAAYFHDAIYATDAGDSEERSAQWAESALPALGLPAATVAEVARLVRLTLHHHPGPDDRNGAVLCDADLAILAADPDTYAGYTRAVRAEYRHVPEHLFRQGRIAVLRNLIDHPRLYATQAARARFEDAARANLANELAVLEAGEN